MCALWILLDSEGARRMNAGFTGTRQGMTEKQKTQVEEWLKYAKFSNTEFLPWQAYQKSTAEFHHGDCVGADEEADAIAHSLHLNVVIHPPVNQRFRAYCSGTVLPAKGYLDRNHDIVDSTDILIAAPKEVEEVVRSGTWATIRYARKVGKQVWIAYPE